MMVRHGAIIVIRWEFVLYVLHFPNAIQLLICCDCACVVAMRGDHVLFDGDGMDGGTIMALPGPSTMQATPATIIVFGQGAGATSTSAANAIAKTNNNQRSPSGVGKFECTMCSLRFASNYNLKRHAR